MATIQAIKEKVELAAQSSVQVQTGLAAAALVSGGIGALALGLMVTLAEISEGIANMLNWVNPVGPLSGKSSIGVIAWLASWFILNRAWKDQDRDMKKAFTIFLILIVLGFLLTFPPIFTLFAAE
jgi:hypothetical protein